MNKKVLFLVNHEVVIYNFRYEVVEALLKEGYEVHISSPSGEKINELVKMGCIHHDVIIDRRGTNLISDIKLVLNYFILFKSVKPDICLTYTIKPNIYGGIVANLTNTKVIHTVTGLGSVFIQDIWQKDVIVFLNRLSFRNADYIYFQNEDNLKLYKKNRIINSNHKTKVVAGSGVNLKKFGYQELKSDENITFTFIGRIFKDKGIEEFLKSADEIKGKYDNVHFNVVGFIDDSKYVKYLENYSNRGIVNYLGNRNDIPETISNSTCIVLPSYGEGRGTVLQEGAAIGRPLITCDTYGCRDNVVDGENGYLCEVGNVKSLTNSMVKFLNLEFESILKMAKKSREKAEKEFDRKLIVEKYLTDIKDIIDRKALEIK